MPYRNPETCTKTLVTGRQVSIHWSSGPGEIRRGVGLCRLTFFVGMDATNVPLQVFTPGETFPTIGYDADEGPLGSAGAIRNDLTWDRRDASSTALLGQVGNRNWTCLPAATFCPWRDGDGQGSLGLMGSFRRNIGRPQGRHGFGL